MNKDTITQKVLETLQIENLEKKEQEHILAQVFDAIVKQAIILTNDSLNEEDKKKFVNLIENGGDFDSLISYFSKTENGVNVLDRAVNDVLKMMNEGVTEEQNNKIN